MVRINRVYTRTGDQGTTALVGGSRVKKNSARVHCFGEVDELNSFIGMARTISENEKLQDISSQLSIIQNELFNLGAYLATPPEKSVKLSGIDEEQISRLEQWIDLALEGLPELTSFVLPGGNELNAALHLARSVCRRVERELIDLSEKEDVSKIALIYLNRLSDYLFAAARKSSFLKNTPEFLWKPG